MLASFPLYSGLHSGCPAMITYENCPNQAIEEFIKNVASAFPEIKGHITFKERGKRGICGNCRSFCGEINIYTAPHGLDYEEMKSTIAHEIGHAHHAQTAPTDFYSRTDYGQEIYAEEFSNMCMARTNDNYHYECYAGFKQKKVYKEQFPDWGYRIWDDCCTYDGEGFSVVLKYRGGGYNRPMFYTWKLTLDNGKEYVDNKHVKLDTAKKNVVRKLRKLGYDCQ